MQECPLGGKESGLLGFTCIDGISGILAAQGETEVE